MWNLLKAELLKLRRCQILWVGLVALALCPLVQYGSQLIVEAEYRNPNYDFSTLFENVVWGNTQMFFPISLVMIGSWLIDRESTHDTLKNIMTIPVSMPKMLGAKLFWVGIFAVLLGIYSVGVTLITGLTVGLSGLTVEVFFHGGTQIVLAALTTYLVCMPLILIFGQIRGAYLGGSLDCNDGIENAAIGWAQPSPEDHLIEKEELAEYEELIRRLYEAISSLPSMQARRVHARYMLGMKVKDIAAMEGITPSQAGKSIHAALRRLRRYFARQKWTVNL